MRITIIPVDVCSQVHVRQSKCLLFERRSFVSSSLSVSPPCYEDIVVLTRPDLRYNITSIKGGSLLRLVQAGKVVLQNDQWMAMPRKVASRVYALGKLLNCMPGRRCCRRIDKPESLMEYLTGAVHDFHRSLHPGDRGESMSCQCSNVSTPFRRVKVGQIQRMPIYTDDVH